MSNYEQKPSQHEPIQENPVVAFLAEVAKSLTPNWKPVKSKPGETAGAAIARAEENKRKWNQGSNNS